MDALSNTRPLVKTSAGVAEHTPVSLVEEETKCRPRAEVILWCVCNTEMPAWVVFLTVSLSTSCVVAIHSSDMVYPSFQHPRAALSEWNTLVSQLGWKCPPAMKIGFHKHSLVSYSEETPHDVNAVMSQYRRPMAELCNDLRALKVDVIEEVRRAILRISAAAP